MTLTLLFIWGELERKDQKVHFEMFILTITINSKGAAKLEKRYINLYFTTGRESKNVAQHFDYAAPYVVGTRAASRRFDCSHSVMNVTNSYKLIYDTRLVDWVALKIDSWGVCTLCGTL
jgi:hypothetical protein